MLIKNLRTSDIHFQYMVESREDYAKFEQINIIAGWTVSIDDKVWEKIKQQKVTVREFVTEEIQMDDITVTNIMTGSKDKGTKTIRRATGKHKEVNLVNMLIKEGSIKVVEDGKIEMPSRNVLESAAKKYNIEFKPQTKDETIYSKVREAIIEAEREKEMFNI